MHGRLSTLVHEQVARGVVAPWAVLHIVPCSRRYAQLGRLYAWHAQPVAACQLGCTACPVHQAASHAVARAHLLILDQQVALALEQGLHQLHQCAHVDVVKGPRYVHADNVGLHRVGAGRSALSVRRLLAPGRARLVCRPSTCRVLRAASSNTRRGLTCLLDLPSGCSRLPRHGVATLPASISGDSMCSAACLLTANCRRPLAPEQASAGQSTAVARCSLQSAPSCSLRAKHSCTLRVCPSCSLRATASCSLLAVTRSRAVGGLGCPPLADEGVQLHIDIIEAED